MNPVPDLGSRLRDGRQQRGLTLHDISLVTKIPTSWLAAIESNHYEALPGGVYRRAYVRSFAAEVGIDPEPLPAGLVSEASREIDERQRPAFWRHASTLIFLALLLLILLLARVLSNEWMGPHSSDSQASATAVGSAATAERAPAAVKERSTRRTAR